MRDLWAYLLGYLVLTVQGEHPERFINLALTRGVFLWDIAWIDGQLLLVRVYAASFRGLRHIARRARCRVRIRAKRGLPFLIHRLRRRKMLAGGALVFCLLLYLFSSFIWTVEVAGTRRIPPAAVLRAAARAGLHPGVFRFRVEPNGVADFLMQELPGVAFAEVHIKGTRARIRITEKALAERDRGPSHVVAKKDGLIKELLVLAGSPRVQEGDVVRRGQILISGVVAAPFPAPEGAGSPPAPSLPRYVRAQGIVRARVWYRGYGEAPRTEVLERITGRAVRIVCIRMEQKEIIIKGPRRIPYALYRARVHRRKFPRWRSITLPVEFVTIEVKEIRRVRVTRSYEEALRLAARRARERLAELVPAGVPVVKRQVKVLQGGDQGPVRVVITAEAVEDIGRERPFQAPRNLGEPRVPENPGGRDNPAID
ncbi:MAG: sporulation protein YqfD [Firmicutes bacterium]|nr:sporulation protein YqfD [Bacillota bacterium]